MLITFDLGSMKDKRNSKNSLMHIATKPANILPYFSAGILVFGVVILGFNFIHNRNEDDLNENKIITNTVLSDSTKTDTTNTMLVIEPKKQTIKKNEFVKKATTTILPEKINLKNDSVNKKEPQKVVIIKKQIIKKDTVYVQR